MPRLLKTEQPHHRKAFERYYALGDQRTYARLAAEIGVDVSTLKLWGRSFGWSQRIGERDAEFDQVGTCLRHAAQQRQGRSCIGVIGLDEWYQSAAAFALQRREPGGDAAHSRTPRCSATVKMSLSPRPHRFIRMI